MRPRNVKFARVVVEPSVQPRAVIAGKDARTLATEILAMSEDEFRMAFDGSPMKRARIARLGGKAAVLLGGVNPDSFNSAHTLPRTSIH
ncbi:MAG: hypothetical protein ACRENQ_17140 [Gemmatimonadaceae bacterium]